MTSEYIWTKYQNIKISKFLGLSIIVLLFALSVVLAQTDSAIVQSSISVSTIVDLSPNTFQFDGIVGSTVLGNNSAEIENVGSTNISQLTFDVTLANSSPWGSGISVAYSVGAYITLSTSNETSTFDYIDYQEWNQTTPTYVINPANAVAQGRFRFAMNEYFWAVTNGNSSGTAQCQNGSLFLLNFATS